MKYNWIRIAIFTDSLKNKSQEIIRSLRLLHIPLNNFSWEISRYRIFPFSNSHSIPSIIIGHHLPPYDFSKLKEPFLLDHIHNSVAENRKKWKALLALDSLHGPAVQASVARDAAMSECATVLRDAAFTTLPLSYLCREKGWKMWGRRMEAIKLVQNLWIDPFPSQIGE